MSSVWGRYFFLCLSFVIVGCILLGGISLSLLLSEYGCAGVGGQKQTTKKILTGNQKASKTNLKKKSFKNKLEKIRKAEVKIRKLLVCLTSNTGGFLFRIQCIKQMPMIRPGFPFGVCLGEEADWKTRDHLHAVPVVSSRFAFRKESWRRNQVSLNDLNG